MKSLFVLLLVFSGLASSGLHAQSEELPTITDALQADGNTATLHAALDAADLLTALDEGGEVVLLAPTNDAFAALPEGVVEKLLEPQNSEALRTLLSHHVVAGGEDAATMTSEKVSAGGAAAIGQVDCSNGTIYMVDKVLLPAGFDPATLE